MTNIYKLESDMTTGKTLFLSKDMATLQILVYEYLQRTFKSFHIDIQPFSDKLIIKLSHEMAPLKPYHITVIPFETNVEVIQ